MFVVLVVDVVSFHDRLVALSGKTRLLQKTRVQFLEISKFRKGIIRHTLSLKHSLLFLVVQQNEEFYDHKICLT